MSKVYRGTVFGTILLTALLLLSTTSFADTFTVMNLNDSGDGSLRQVILDANTNPGPDEIVFMDGLSGTIPTDSPGDNTYTGQIAITDNLTITGPGADVITIDAQRQDRIFQIGAAFQFTGKVVLINGLTFMNGLVSGSINDRGGAIFNNEELSIDSCVFDNNSAIIDGGAIYNTGTIGTITKSTFIRNSAKVGGAIFNYFQGTIETITNSTFSGNSANDSSGRGGGAIYNEGILNAITNSTFSGNSSQTTGGAIDSARPLSISFTTIVNNSARLSAGGVRLPLNVVNTIRNSIVAFNTGENCNLGLEMGAGATNNYSNDDSCGFDFDSSFISLGLLGDNGGPTETVALLGGDPLNGASADCDAANNLGVVVPNDQRFFQRPFGGACDAGSYENDTVISARVTITKLTKPDAGTGLFTSTGFDGLSNCKITTDPFILNDTETASCIAPPGDYLITEDIPDDEVLFIFCQKAPEIWNKDSLAGTLSFTIEAEGDDVDCLFINSPAYTAVRLTPEPPGANCEFGGEKIETGLDVNGDGALDDEEVQDTDYVCNGAPGEQRPGGADEPEGPEGPAGEDGNDGLNSITDLNVEPAGEHCGNGGIRIDTGLDLNRNGVLDPEEITETAYVCESAEGEGSYSPKRDCRRRPCGAVALLADPRRDCSEKADNIYRQMIRFRNEWV